MKMNVVFFACLIFVSACMGRKQQVADEIKVLQAKEIQIPSKLLLRRIDCGSDGLHEDGIYLASSHSVQRICNRFATV